MFKTLPPSFCAIHSLAKTCVQWNVPLRTMPTTALKALGVSFSVRAMKLPAALLITVSMRGRIDRGLCARRPPRRHNRARRRWRKAAEPPPPPLDFLTNVPERFFAAADEKHFGALSAAKCRAIERPRPEPPPLRKHRAILQHVLLEHGSPPFEL